ncbi:MAG: MFS transporter, partial [Pseudolabrys sp.]|nr:MFS transporter [Pseudolabrys sp.]
TLRLHGHETLQASDFPPAFLAVAVFSALSVVMFTRLAPDAGAELANRLPKPETRTAETSDQKVA